MRSQKANHSPLHNSSFQLPKALSRYHLHNILPLARVIDACTSGSAIAIQSPISPVSSRWLTSQNVGVDVAASSCNLGGGTPDAAIAPYISPEVT